MRVLVVNAQEIIAEGVRGMLACHHDLVEVVDCVPAVADLRAVTTPTDVDLVLFDLASRRNGGAALSPEMMEECGPSRVVIFTDDADERRLFEALRLGVGGYLLKALSSAQLVDHLVRASRGEFVVDPTMAARMAMRAVRLGDGHGWPGSELGLSRREGDVLSRLGDGLSNREIAASLIVGEETVKTHLRSIYRKLGVNDRAQAVGSALRRGILT